MKVLSIGSDKNLFKEKSAVRRRALEYGALFEELHIIVFAKKEFGLEAMELGNGVWVYTTNSRSKWLYLLDAVKTGRKIVLKGGKPKDESWMITCQDPFESGIVGWFLAKTYGLPLQLQLHTDFLSPYFGDESFLNSIRVRIARFLIPRASCLRAVSLRVKSSLGALLQGKHVKTSVLPVQSEACAGTKEMKASDLRKKYRQFEFLVLVVARLAVEKNVSLALEAMRDVVTKHPQTGLLLVGDGPERAKLSILAVEYGIEDNVIFKGWRDDLETYYKNADLFLQTSDYEGYGLALVEAARAACPLVSTDVGVVGELFKDGESVLVSRPRNAGSISADIKRLIRNKELRQKLAKNAKEIADVAVLSKEEYLARYKKTFEQCLSKNPKK